MVAPFSSDRPVQASIRNVIHDEERLNALYRYDILDTDSEPAFDRVTRLAAHLFDAPTALVSFVDADRQWFKSTVGFDDDQIGLDASFGVHTLEKGDVMTVEDLSEDERFADNPYVTDHGFRFYAGAPLVTPDDHRLGAVCVLDTEPRSVSEDMEERLADLAAMVMDELELRREQAVRRETHAEFTGNPEVLKQAQQLAAVGGSMYDPQTEEVTWTDETYRIFGLSPDADLDLDSVLDFYASESRAVLQAELERLLDEGGEYDVELDAATVQGEYRRIRSVGTARRENGETTKIVGAAQDITKPHRDRRLKEVQSTFFEWIATGAPIDTVLDEIIHFTEEELPGAAVSVLKLEDDRLRPLAAPSLPDRFVEAIDGTKIGPNAGTCGAAAYRGQEAVTEDIREDDRWDAFRAVADRADVRSCNSQVIRGSDGALFGTFSVYRATPGAPAPPQQELVKRMAHVASVALERKRNERALRESEQRWRTLVEGHPGPVHVSIDGKYAYANDETAELLGVDEADDLIGRDVAEFVPPDEQHRLQDRAELVYDGREEAELIETRVQRADGTERIVLVRSVPIQYQGQAAAQTTMRDVTERRETERELRDSNRRLRLALEAADAGTFEYRIAADQVEMDERAVDLFGLTSGSRSEEPSRFEEIILEDDFERMTEVFDRVAEAEESRYEVSYRVRRPDNGRVRHIHSQSLVLRDEDGAPERAIGISRDVTEQRRRKKALERQNDLFTKAQDIASVGAWEYDLRSEEATLSDEVYRIHGIAPDAEMTPERSIHFYHPDDRPAIREAFTQAVEEGEPYDLELRFTTDDGAQRWVRTRGEPQREDGEIVRVRGVIQDITERKAAEEDLRRSREQLSMAVEGGNIGTWNWDLTTDTVLFNDRWAEMLGYAREELDFHFRTWEELVHPEDLSRALDELGAYIDGEDDTYAPEIRMRTKSGTWRWIQTIGKVVERDEDGVVTRVAGIHLDIDDRKRAEQALRDAKTRYQTLIEHFPDGGVFLFDENLEYTIAGGKGLDDVGLAPSDFEGNTIDDLFPPEIADPQLRYYRRALEGEKKVFGQTLDGRHYRVQTLPLRDETGDVVAGMAVSQDITERKETRQRLERYREYTDRLLNAVDDLFFAVDEEGQLRRWNDRVSDVTGYSDDELGTMTIFPLVPESEHERVAAKIADAFGTGSSKVEVPLLRKDGATIPYEFVGSVVEHPEDDLHLVGIGRDIAERKQRERLLEQAETFFQNAQNALFIVDVQRDGDEPTFSIQRVNPAYETKTGFSNENIRGVRLQEVLGEEAARYGRVMYRRCVDRREPLEYEEEVPLGGTTTYWTTCIAPVVVDDTVQRIVGTTRNVTEQRRRKEALERKNDLFTKAQDIARVGAWEYDVQSDEMIMTDEAYRIWGLPPSDGMTREKGISFYHPEDQPVVRDAIARAVEEGASYDLELRLITEDGEQRWVRTRGEPQEEEGEIVRIRGTIQDVTERVQRREALTEAKEAAEEADRIKSALLSNMNHEFRTPLTSIISFSELLSREPELVETFADRILGGGRRLLHTLNTVMDFAELEAGSVSLTPMRVDVNSLVQSTVDTLSHLIDQDLSVQIHAPTGPHVARLDEHHVDRILTHLVHNAIKFTEEGTIEITLRETADGVEVSISDPGIGIDAEVLPHMFDEFAQASSGSDRTHEGNGIGLTIVKRLVDQMDGDVTLHSTPGEGTEVTVRLPNLD